MPFPRSLILLAALVCCAFAAAPAQAVVYNVNRTFDQRDFSPGDSVCDVDPLTTGNQCTLRAAVEDAGGLDTSATSTVNVPPGDYPLSLGAIAITSNLDVLGAGARSTIVRQTTPDRVFYAGGTVTLSGMRMSNGIADSPEFYGGNVFNDGGTLTILNSTISGGHAGSGGGVGNQFGELTIRNSTLTGNAADIGGSDAGAILNIGNADQAPSLTVENSTISGNSASLGGGIFSYGNAGNVVTVRSSTIASNNSGARGGAGGLLIGNGSASVENSIVALNGSGASNPATPNCSVGQGAAITSSGHNLESGSECGFDSPGDVQNADPKLGPLQNAGGPTDTRPLLAGSPAINKGNSGTCLPTDQRFVARPQGPACDIGAFEAAASAPETVIVSGPAVITKDRTPTFTFSASVPGTTFECSVDRGPFLPCTSPVSLPTLKAGTHSFRVRAKDPSGATDPTPAELIFAIPAVIADLEAPVIGRTVNAEPVSGEVFVAVPGSAGPARNGARAAQKGLRFIPLREAKQVPVGSYFNTRRGRVRLQSATRRRGRRQAGVFSGGLFQTLQSRKRSAGGVFELRLKGSSFRNCTVRSRQAGIARRTKRRIRRVSGNARGRFRTRGRYSAATVRGTRWTVTDRCDGTLTKVTSGRVAVRDFRRKKTRILRRGKSYLARAPG